MAPRRRRIFRLEVGTRRVERDLDDEIELHIQLRTKRLIADGLDPIAARNQALRQFGDLPALRAECLIIDKERERAMKRASRLQDLRQDVVYGVRSLRQHKGYAAVILLILALGIGANTALFTLVDALMLRTLPVPAPEQLVTVGDPTRTGSVSQGSAQVNLASYPVYADVRDQNRVVRACTRRGARAGSTCSSTRGLPRARRRGSGASARAAGLGELLQCAPGAGARRTALLGGGRQGIGRESGGRAQPRLLAAALRAATARRWAARCV